MHIGGIEWVVVASFDTMPAAAVARGRLEAEGIPCLLADEHLVQADWLHSIAVGGIRLRVPAEAVHRARRLLEADLSHLLEGPGADDGPPRT